MLFINLQSHDVFDSHSTCQLHFNTDTMSGLTSAGAVLDLIIEKLGDEDQVCEDVEHHCDYLREGHGKKKFTIDLKMSWLREDEFVLFIGFLYMRARKRVDTMRTSFKYL